MSGRSSDEEILKRIGWSDRGGERERDEARRSFRKAAAFIAPAVCFVAIFLLAPVVHNIWISFTKWRRFSGMDEFAGTLNYTRMASNQFFGDALINTGIWVVASVTLPLAFGLGIALLMRNLPGEGLFKNIIFIPRILAPTAVAVLWYYVYAPDGVLNGFLGSIVPGKVDIGWLYQDNTITGAIIATFVWQSVGLVMVLILLGLAAIPKDPIEAARLDGATPFQVLRHIILPLLLPTLLVVTILSVLAGFTAFDLLWVMGESYPGQRTLSLVVFMYFEAFQKGSWAFGSAIAVVLGIVALSVTWIQAALQNRIDKMTK